MPRSAASLLAAVAVLSVASLSGCRSTDPRPPVMPRGFASDPQLSDFIAAHVERSDGTPEWAMSRGDDDRFFYGIGVIPRSARVGNPATAATREAEDDLLRALGAVAAGGPADPRGRELVRGALELERVGVNEASGTFYALVRLDPKHVAALASEEIARLDARLFALGSQLATASSRGELGLRAALAMRGALEERRLRSQQIRALGAEPPAPAEGIDPEALAALAGDVLRAHTVHVSAEGPGAQQLAAVIRHELEAAKLATNAEASEVEWGWADDGDRAPRVELRLQATDGWSRRHPYATLEGTLAIALDGGEAPADVLRVRAVGRGASDAEALDRAEQVAAQQVRDLVQAVLRR